MVLAGLQDYLNTGDIGLAKNRMVSRPKNLLRHNGLQRKHEPKAESAFPEPDEGQGGVLDAGTRRDASEETAIVRDLLGHLSGRRSRVVELRTGGYWPQKIADQLGIGLPTVDRELEPARKYKLEKFN